MGAPRRSEAGRGHRDRAVQEDFSKEEVFEQKPGEAREQAIGMSVPGRGDSNSWPRDGVVWGARRRPVHQRVRQEESGRSRGHRGRRHWPPSLAGHRRKIGLCSCPALRFI